MEYTRDSMKRHRGNNVSNTNPPTSFIILHTVECEGTKLHHRHPNNKSYLDVPRLLQGDSKASELRGDAPVGDIEDFLEENSDVSIVVHRKYSCTQYHSGIEEMFDTLDRPKHPDDSSMIPFFFCLRSPGKEAVPQKETVELLSDSLKEAIIKLTAVEPAVLEHELEINNMPLLYNYFYFYRTGRLQSSQKLDEAEQKQIDMFQRLMETLFGTEYNEADTLFSRGRVMKKYCRMLFPPDELIVTNSSGEPRAYLVDRCVQTSQAQLVVYCKSWGFDGSFFEESSQVQIDWHIPDEEIDIDQLDTYPLRYDKSHLETKLRSRGQKFWQCRQKKYVAYCPPFASFAFQTTNPRFMVDVQTFQQIHDKQETAHSGQPGPAVTAENPPDDSFLLLLPPTIRGFGFHDKKWQTLSVDRITDISWNTNAFKHLVLDHTKKELIQAMIASHSQHTSSADVIEGKGNGLILLLHGGPGTGKTLTAESVAELTHRPLYRVTCGDVGTNAEDIESYLETVFYLSTKWNCVVLLDEADIFLEERSHQDLHRNALVSVFIRVLEYYEGILVLTSNRVGIFDEAFRSRVQLTLQYPDLNESGRRLIWHNFIHGLEHSTNIRAKIDELRQSIDVLCQKRLNGREIRNAIKTATLLAQFRGQTLESRHLVEVLAVSGEFEEYLTRTHGHTSEEWVQANGARVSNLERDGK